MVERSCPCAVISAVSTLFSVSVFQGQLVVDIIIMIAGSKKKKHNYQ